MPQRMIISISVLYKCFLLTSYLSSCNYYGGTGIMSPYKIFLSYNALMLKNFSKLLPIINLPGSSLFVFVLGTFELSLLW